MALADTVAGVGCYDRDSVQHIGTDVLFMSYSGLRSVGRVIQEKSLPISDLSGTVKTELIEILTQETLPLASIYSPENSFYLVSFLSQDVTYCFDLKGRLENGAYRVTRWPSSLFRAFDRSLDGTLYVGTTAGVATYTGYDDDDVAYRFRYYSPSLTYGDSSKTKMLKKMIPTIVGGANAAVVLKWAYDFSEEFSSQVITIGSTSSNTAYFGVSEYNTAAEYTGGTLTSRLKANTTGSGSTVTIGIEADINGFPLSLQEINTQALIGKIV